MKSSKRWMNWYENLIWDIRFSYEIPMTWNQFDDQIMTIWSSTWTDAHDFIYQYVFASSAKTTDIKFSDFELPSAPPGCRWPPLPLAENSVSLQVFHVPRASPGMTRFHMSVVLVELDRPMRYVIFRDCGKLQDCSGARDPVPVTTVSRNADTLFAQHFSEDCRGGFHSFLLRKVLLN